MIRRVPVFVAFAGIVTLAACGGGGGGGGSPVGGGGGSPTAPPIVTENYAFPAGDATAVGGGTAWDIIGVKTTLSGSPGSPAGNAYDTLRVDVTFAQNVATALPAPGQPLAAANQLGVSVALDIDGNPSTGEYVACYGVSSLHPFEYFSDAGTQPNRLADGNYGIIGPNGGAVYSGASNPPSEADTSVAGQVFTQKFYLPTVDVFALGAVPRIGIGVAAYNGAGQTPTDCVPRYPVIEEFTS
jgi:hypothetical protein